VFESFTDYESKIHVEIGMGTKCSKGIWNIIPVGVRRHIESENVLWVPKLKRSVILVSMIEKKGFDVVFQDGKC
jgi:hypothetical protein